MYAYNDAKKVITFCQTVNYDSGRARKRAKNKSNISLNGQMGKK